MIYFALYIYTGEKVEVSVFVGLQNICFMNWKFDDHKVWHKQHIKSRSKQLGLYLLPVPTTFVPEKVIITLVLMYQKQHSKLREKQLRLYLLPVSITFVPEKEIITFVLMYHSRRMCPWFNYWEW